MRPAANLKFGGKVRINDNDTSNAYHRRVLGAGFILGEEIQLLPGLYLMIK